MKQELVKGRLTSKKIITWLNEVFPEWGAPHIQVYEIERTRFRQDEYEAGACKLHIRYRNTEVDEGSLMSQGSFMSFYSIRELQEYLEMGYELYLKTGQFRLLSNIELDVKKT